MKRGEVEGMREGLKEVRRGRKEARDAERLRRMDDGESTVEYSWSVFVVDCGRLGKRGLRNVSVLTLSFLSLAAREYSALKVQTEQDLYKASRPRRSSRRGRQTRGEEAYLPDQGCVV